MLSIFTASEGWWYCSGLSYAGRELLLGAENIADDPTATDWVDDEGFNVPPPGEEGTYMSHAGGFDEVCHSILKEVSGRRWEFLLFFGYPSEFDHN
jgi:hypothetical protein